MTELLKTVICSYCSFWYMLIHSEIRHGPDWRSLQSVIYYSHTETVKRMAWMSTQSEKYKRNSSGLLPGITIVHHTTVNLVVWWNSNILRIFVLPPVFSGNGLQERYTHSSSRSFVNHCIIKRTNTFFARVRKNVATISSVSQLITICFPGP